MATLTYEGGSLVLRTGYDPVFLNALKEAIPAADRRWDSGRRVWLVQPRHAETVAELAAAHHTPIMSMPLIPDRSPVVKKRLDVRYVGTAKDRTGGGRNAHGWHRGGWNVVFPETVLRKWFQNRGALGRDSLYATLGVAHSAQPDEIRRAYFRLARQWHPDVAREEPQAAAMFMQIHDAYEVLRDTEQRARYDAGLALQAAMDPGTSARRLIPSHDSAFGYRPPLRCGLITVEGTECLGRFTVDRILAWDDIVDHQGRTLVTVWPVGADTFIENWV